MDRITNDEVIWIKEWNSLNPSWVLYEGVLEQMLKQFDGWRYLNGQTVKFRTINKNTFILNCECCLD